MPGAEVLVDARNGQGHSECLSLKYEAGLGQIGRAWRKLEEVNSVCNGIIVYPFYGIIHTDCHCHIDRVVKRW